MSSFYLFPIWVLRVNKLCLWGNFGFYLIRTHVLKHPVKKKGQKHIFDEPENSFEFFKDKSSINLITSLLHHNV